MLEHSLPNRSNVGEWLLSWPGRETMATASQGRQGSGDDAASGNARLFVVSDRDDPSVPVLLQVVTSEVTLVVTIVGGVAIYYLTRQPSAPAPAEELVYDIDTPVVFESDQTELSFTNVRVKNVGNESATNVSVVVQFGDKVKVVDKKVTLSSGPAGTFSAKMDAHQVELKIPVLTPNETATLAILTDAVDEENPTVGVKSDASTGSKGSLTSVSTVRESRNNRLDQTLAVLVPLALLAQIVLLLVFRQRFRRFFRRIIPNFRSINNTAFVYLHRGLTDEALALLSDGIATSGAEPTMLANYGLALGAKGDRETAERVFDAAEFWAEANVGEQALIAFNRAIVCLRDNNESDGINLMRKAFQLSKHDIARYASYSDLIQELREQHAELHSLLHELGVAKKRT